MNHREEIFSLAHHLCSLCTIAPRFSEKNLRKHDSSLLAATAAKSLQSCPTLLQIQSFYTREAMGSSIK